MLEAGEGGAFHLFVVTDKNVLRLVFGLWRDDQGSVVVSVYPFCVVVCEAGELDGGFARLKCVAHLLPGGAIELFSLGEDRGAD